MGSQKTILSVQDICSIIEKSHKSGVIELKFDSLHVRFGGPAKQEDSLVYPFVPQTPVGAATDLTAEQHRQQLKQALESEEVLTREEQLERALIEDPVLYEELLRNGELTDVVDTSDTGDDGE